MNQICPGKYSKLFKNDDDVRNGDPNFPLEIDSAFYRNPDEKYRIAKRCKEIVFDAWLRKLRIIRKLRKPEIKSKILRGLNIRAFSKYMVGDEKLAEKIFNYGRSRKEVSTRELERKFSISRNHLNFILSFYEDEWELSHRGKQEYIIFKGKNRLIHPREFIINELIESLASFKFNK